MSDATRNSNDLASRLENIVDDSAAREQCAQWAREQILAGRSVEEVAAHLTCEGWQADEAAEIAEQARRETRDERGVTTREHVTRAYGVGDPNVMRHATPKAHNIGTALAGLLRGLARLWRTRDVGRRK
jgi:hypothetical protein